MTHQHDKTTEKSDTFGRTAHEAARYRQEWSEEQPFQVIPRSTETPEERLARLDDFPEANRESIAQQARDAIRERDGER